MKRALYLSLLLLLALTLACTPRGRGGRSGDDDDDDDDSAGDDDDATGDDDDSTGDDDDSVGGVDGDYSGQMTLTAELEGSPTELCTSPLTVSISGPNLIGSSDCELFGGIGIAPIALNGNVTAGEISGFATVDLTSIGGTAAQGNLNGDVGGGSLEVSFEIDDKAAGMMSGEGSATLD